LFALAACILSPPAHAQVAETPEEAQQFLMTMLESGAINFQIGNRFESKEKGLIAHIPGTFYLYRKKLLRGWSLEYSKRTDHRVYMKYSGFSSQDGEGDVDSCMTTVRSVVPFYVLSGVEASFDLPTRSLSKEDTFGDKKTVTTLDRDPEKSFGGAYIVDWRRTTFSRKKMETGSSRGETEFLLETGNPIPYASLAVNGDSLADYVENSLRVLQLSCRR